MHAERFLALCCWSLSHHTEKWCMIGKRMESPLSLSLSLACASLACQPHRRTQSQRAAERAFYTRAAPIVSEYRAASAAHTHTCGDDSVLSHDFLMSTYIIIWVWILRPSHAPFRPSKLEIFSKGFSPRQNRHQIVNVCVRGKSVTRARREREREHPHTLDSKQQSASLDINKMDQDFVNKLQ